MATIDVNYEGREMIQAPELPFEPDVGVELDHGRAFGIPVEDDYVVFVIPAQGIVASEPERRKASPILQTKMTAGAVIDCEKKVWTIESEPTGDDRFGFVVYTSERKAIIAGSGTVSDKEAGDIEFSCTTVFDRVTTSPKAIEVKAGCEGNVYTGGWKCGASVRGEF